MTNPIVFGPLCGSGYNPGYNSYPPNWNYNAGKFYYQSGWHSRLPSDFYGSYFHNGSWHTAHGHDNHGSTSMIKFGKIEFC